MFQMFLDIEALPNEIKLKYVVTLAKISILYK